MADYLEQLLKSANHVLYIIDQRLAKGDITIEKAAKLIKDISYAISSATGRRAATSPNADIPEEPAGGDIQDALSNIRRTSLGKE